MMTNLDLQSNHVNVFVNSFSELFISDTIRIFPIHYYSDIMFLNNRRKILLKFQNA